MSDLAMTLIRQAMETTTTGKIATKLNYSDADARPGYLGGGAWRDRESLETMLELQI